MASVAYRYRSVSNPAFNLLKVSISQTKSTPKAIPSLRLSLSSPTFPRSISQLGFLQSLLPLHSAVSSARLTSCLGLDSTCSRSLSHGILCSANPGV
ncbi:hypothetical protein Ancab_022905 [Ancistrocladus abbreviatus]